MSEPGHTLVPPPHDLKRRASGGARWTAASAVGTTVLLLAQLAILGRLLGPEAFGLIAMVLVVVNFAQLFGEMGFSQAIVQRRDPTRDELSSLYWTNIVLSAGVFLVVLLVAPLVARGFGAPELTGLLSVAAVAFLIIPFGAQFQALAQKRLHFRLLAIAEVANSLLALVVAVSTALWLAAGAWALVWGLLAGTTTKTVVLISYGWRGETRPRLHFRRSELRGYLSFGLYYTGSMTLNFFNTRLAQLLVGALLGVRALGFYSVAENLVLQWVQRFNPVLTKVSFPIFSMVQDDEARLRRGYLQLVQLMMTINAPAMIGIAAVAPTLLPLFMGEQWVPAVPLLQVLALYALLRSLGNTLGSLLLATGRANWSLYWNLALLLVVPPVVYLASLSGEVSYIPWALLASQVLLVMLSYWFLIRRLIGPCFGEYLKVCSIPILLAGGMGAIVIATGRLLPDLPALSHLGLQVLAGILSYTMLMLLFQRTELRQVLELALPGGSGKGAGEGERLSGGHS